MWNILWVLSYGISYRIPYIISYGIPLNIIWNTIAYLMEYPTEHNMELMEYHMKSNGISFWPSYRNPVNIKGIPLEYLMGVPYGILWHTKCTPMEYHLESCWISYIASHEILWNISWGTIWHPMAHQMNSYGVSFAILCNIL